MAKAEIKLMKGRSLTVRGRKLLPGYPQTITDAADIQYFKGVSTVQVTVLEDSPKKVSAPAPEIEKKASVEPKQEPKNMEPAKKRFSEGTLKDMNKTDLISVATGMGLYVDKSDKKKVIITEILEAQDAEE